MCEYKSLPCVFKMSKKYQEMFDEMVSAYAEKLSARIVTADAVFTLHDFEHHCFDIYKIISYVLFDGEIVYNEEIGLSQRELLILNLAVLFHDISMSASLDWDRETHSKESAEFIQREYDNPNKPLRNKTNLTSVEIKALKAIILAHSNIKDELVSAEEKGLCSKKLIEYNDRLNKPIRTKFLAGVLRIADELDVSSERLGTAELEQQIEEGKNRVEELKKLPDADTKEGKIRKWEKYIESLKHWKKLHLISEIKKDEDGEVVELCVDDEYIERCLDSGQTDKSLARDLVQIYLEIDGKLQEAIKIAFSEKNVKKYISVKEVKIVTQNESLKAEVEDNLSVRSLKKEKNNAKKVTRKDVVEKHMPQIIDKELEKEIFNEVNKRNLIKVGHYLLNEKYCARDWIDTKEVVETKKILNKLVEAVVKDINSKKHGEYVIVGVDLVGTLLASRVAFALQKPLTYIVPEKEENNNTNQEIELNIDKNVDVILLIDSIVTGDTLKRAINKYSLKDRIDSIYTIFFRGTEKVECDSTYMEKIHSVNNLFKIELFEKENCIYNKNRCIAQNQKISNK